jgi:nitroimidazol reductase NimA-like FMN-containing flavoprotein (pyridoxamine 5'-phosphate oxidase superfamily)
MRTVIIKDRSRINDILKKCKICYVAMSLDNVPYVLPMSFAISGDTVILHSGKTGRMAEILQKNSRVCINWTYGEDLAW